MKTCMISLESVPGAAPPTSWNCCASASVDLRITTTSRASSRDFSADREIMGRAPGETLPDLPAAALLEKPVAKHTQGPEAVLFDCAAAYDETGGARLENLVACCLLKFRQFRRDARGESWEFFYLRDREGREVDFVVTQNRRVHCLIEVKVSDGAASPSLGYYTRKLNPKESIQLVLNLQRPQERSGIKTLPLAEWLEALS